MRSQEHVAARPPVARQQFRMILRLDYFIRVVAIAESLGPADNPRVQGLSGRPVIWQNRRGYPLDVSSSRTGSQRVIGVVGSFRIKMY